MGDYADDLRDQDLDDMIEEGQSGYDIDSDDYFESDGELND